MEGAGGGSKPEAIDLSGWQKVFEQTLKDLYEGKIKPGELDIQDVLDTYNKLSDAAGKGYGKDWTKTHGDLPEEVRDNVRMMKQNIYKFSAAKDSAMLRELNSLLYDGNRLRSFEEFKAEADKLGLKYKQHWLEAEYRTAVHSGYMAAKWASIEANKGLFPNLKYKTQGDDRVRKEHDELDGIIAPIDSPFWSKYYPPNGWRCRCDAVQTAEPASRLIPTKTKLVKPEFEINIGKTGQIYNEDSKTGHRFFALAESDPNWAKRFELSKLEAGYDTITTPKGNKVRVSIYADEKDLKKNLTSAVNSFDNTGLTYEIRPDLNIGWKNPEYKIDGLIADRVAGDIINGIKDKRKQLKTFIKEYNKKFQQNKISDYYAIHIDITDVTINYDIARKINGELKQGNNLKFIVLENNQKYAILKRDDSYVEIVKKVNSIIAK